MLRFDIPDAGFDQFHFWCNIHGKLLGDTMRREIVILHAKQLSKLPDFETWEDHLAESKKSGDQGERANVLV